MDCRVILFYFFLLQGYFILFCFTCAAGLTGIRISGHTNSHSVSYAVFICQPLGYKVEFLKPAVGILLKVASIDPSEHGTCDLSICTTASLTCLELVVNTT